ncbi:hypothetical protein ACH4SP_03580 [Streptomyces sp. NPDC021093]|uniref:hypothetical protein n=1 Tax=Streptomyces sp. NPDC021093 TaxID=3365112 RepID=UPI003798DEA6
MTEPPGPVIRIDRRRVHLVIGAYEIPVKNVKQARRLLEGVTLFLTPETPMDEADALSDFPELLTELGEQVASALVSNLAPGFHREGLDFFLAQIKYLRRCRELGVGPAVLERALRESWDRMELADGLLRRSMATGNGVDVAATLEAWRDVLADQRLMALDATHGRVRWLRHQAGLAHRHAYESTRDADALTTAIELLESARDHAGAGPPGRCETLYELGRCLLLLAEATEDPVIRARATATFRTARDEAPTGSQDAMVYEAALRAAERT